jgi:hypothetical protein
MESASGVRELRATESVRLDPGHHRDARDGVCIVELASILAGERFSDTPRCVCEVIASFLRSWNDRLGYADRQRLLPYAERIIDTAGDPEATRRRRDFCLAFAGAKLEGGPISRSWWRLRMRARLAVQIGVGPAVKLDRGAGEYAARLCFGREGPDAAFDLLDRVLEIGAGSREADVAPPAAQHWAPAVTPSLGSNSNGNGNGSRNGHDRDELGIRATIIARERGAGGAAASKSNANDNGASPARRRRARALR